MQRIWLKDRDDHLRADVSETDISEKSEIYRNRTSHQKTM